MQQRLHDATSKQIFINHNQQKVIDNLPINMGISKLISTVSSGVVQHF
jgi:hypothetical protein